VTRAGRRAALLLSLGAAVALLVWLSAAGTAPDAAPVGRGGPAPEVAPVRLPVAGAGAAAPDAPAAQEPAPLLGHGLPRPIDPRASPRVAGRVLRRGDDAPLDDVEVLVIVDDPNLHEPAIVGDLRTVGGDFALPPELVERGPHTLQFRWYASGPPPPVGGVESNASRHEWNALPSPVTARTDRGRTAGTTLRLDNVAGSLDALEVWLDTGWIARGRVVDVTGRPVRGVQVLDRVLRWRPYRMPAVSGEDGGFSLGDLDPAAPLALVLWHMGEDVPGSARDVQPPADGDVLDLGDLALPYAVPPLRR
jgi:hypothetical protein